MHKDVYGKMAGHVIEGLKKRNMEGIYCENGEEAARAAADMIGPGELGRLCHHQRTGDSGSSQGKGGKAPGISGRREEGSGKSRFPGGGRSRLFPHGRQRHHHKRRAGEH